jgi:hypothetical protein
MEIISGQSAEFPSRDKDGSSGLMTLSTGASKGGQGSSGWILAGEAQGLCTGVGEPEVAKFSLPECEDGQVAPPACYSAGGSIHFQTDVTTPNSLDILQGNHSVLQGCDVCLTQGCGSWIATGCGRYLVGRNTG